MGQGGARGGGGLWACCFRSWAPGAGLGRHWDAHAQSLTSHSQPLLCELIRPGADRPIYTLAPPAWQAYNISKDLQPTAITLLGN
jgi:hypothetical protein